MITDEINKSLSDIDSFVGTFPCNELPFIARRPAFIVVNTAPLPKRSRAKIVQGKHWVAILLSDDDNEYFDSFGYPPKQPDIVRFLGSQGSVLQYNTQMLQNPFSDVCGAYCVDYVRQRAQNVGFQEYLGSFTSDVVANDRAVVERVTWQL
jgi:hypothetical protein